MQLQLSIALVTLAAVAADRPLCYSAPSPPNTTAPYVAPSTTSTPETTTSAPTTTAAPTTTPAPTTTEAPFDPCAFKTGDVLALKSDIGNYLGRCSGCIFSGAADSDSAFVHVKEAEINGAAYAQWKVTTTGDGKLALQSDTGKYLARCNGCARGAAYPDEAFVHVRDWKVGGWAQWTCVNAGNGKIGLKSDTGKFLARCNGCLPRAAGTDAAFVHESKVENPWAQWTAKKLN